MNCFRRLWLVRSHLFMSGCELVLQHAASLQSHTQTLSHLMETNTPHMKHIPNTPAAHTHWSRRYLLIQGFVMLEERFERLEHLHLTGDAGGRLSLTLDHGHPQRTLVTRHQTLQMLQQQLRPDTTQITLRRDQSKGRSADEPHHQITTMELFSNRDPPEFKYKYITLYFVLYVTSEHKSSIFVAIDIQN